jgi:hypothetical protein
MAEVRMLTIDAAIIFQLYQRTLLGMEPGENTSVTKSQQTYVPNTHKSPFASGRAELGSTTI